MNQPSESIRKILLVADVPGWAFHHHAKDMMAMPSDKVQFDLKYWDVKRSDLEKYDLIYPMAVSMAHHYYKRGFPMDKFAAGITSMRQFRSVMTVENKLNDSFLPFFNSLRGVNTGSEEFVQIFSQYRHIYKNRIGIYEDVFKPNPKPTTKDKFTVGWVGADTKSPLKGFSLVNKAVKALDVSLEIKTYSKNLTPREKMVEFYQGLDCFVCSSRSEHIPLPVLEAAACGVPVISTHVGIAPELIDSYENGILVERNVQAIRDAIKYLMDNPDKRQSMALAIRETILKEWTWKECWKEWENFFTSI